MLRAYVEFTEQPQSYAVREHPDGTAILKLYDEIERLPDTEDGQEHWRAVCYTLNGFLGGNVARRVAENVNAWLERARHQARSEAERAVRQERSRLLADSDYAMAADYPATDAERDAWRAYRQALRDVPEQSGFPWKISWPEPPAREKCTDTILGVIDELLGGGEE